MVTLAVAAGWLSTRNSLFRLSDIEVRTDDASLSREVRNSLLGELGRNLFALSLTDIEAEVLAIRKVDRVSIHRRWPSRIVISVVPKLPVAMMFLHNQLWGVDRLGRKIEVISTPMALPLFKGVQNPETLPLVFEWLHRLQAQEPLELDSTRFNEIVWDTERGLVLKSFDLELDVELGSQDFDTAWRRAEAAYAYLKSKGQKPSRLDATYRARVIASGSNSLQNSQIGLNLEQLVRRKDAQPAAAR